MVKLTKKELSNENTARKLRALLSRASLGSEAARSAKGAIQGDVPKASHVDNGSSQSSGDSEDSSSAGASEEEFHDAESYSDPEDDVESYSPPHSPGKRERISAFVRRNAPAFASRMERMKRNLYDWKEGSLGDRIMKKEKLCRRLKEIEEHVHSELKAALAAKSKAQGHLDELVKKKRDAEESVVKEKFRWEEKAIEVVKAFEEREAAHFQPRMRELEKNLKNEEALVKKLERRSSTIKEAYKKCREEIDVITMHHNQQYAHEAAVIARKKAEKEADAARRHAGIF
jgi:hypothetical protein